MRKMPWLRLYSEIIDDEKLRLLAYEDRWHYIAILCCKRKGILDESANESLMWRKVAVKLGLQVRELEEVSRRLAEVDLVDAKTLQPTGWDNRQFDSDGDPTRNERQRRFKEKKRAEKTQRQQDVTHDNGEVTRYQSVKKRVTVTKITRTDTDTETELEDKDLTDVSCSSQGYFSVVDSGKGVKGENNAASGVKEMDNTGKKSAKKFDPLAMAIPDCIPQQAWVDFVQHRRDIRKPLTELAARKLCDQLRQASSAGIDICKAINTSITNGWRGVFTEKSTRGNGNGRGIDWYSTDF